VELVAAVTDVLTELGFTDFIIRVNDRRLLAALLAAAGVGPAQESDALVALDKLDKIGHEGVAAELASRGISAAATERCLEMFASHPGESSADAVARLGAVLGDRRDALDAVTTLLALAETTSAAGRLRLDPSLARGLSYYTGAIMEIAVPDLAGSLGGGGRYDNLVGMFLGQSVPACGFSLGLERILVVMGERSMFPTSLATTPADVMVAVFDAKDAAHALRIAQTLRASGLRVMVYPDADKIGKQIKYADSQRIPYVAILGGDEIANSTVTVKNLAAQTQNTYEQAAAGAAILEGLRHRG
jgi:histidyl-tRNA synthetase